MHTHGQKWALIQQRQLDRKLHIVILNKLSFFLKLPFQTGCNLSQHILKIRGTTVIPNQTLDYVALPEGMSDSGPFPQILNLNPQFSF